MKKKIFSRVAVIYSLFTLLYYIVIRFVVGASDFNYNSRVGLDSTVGIAFLTVLVLSQIFKIVSLFFVRKRYAVIVGLSVCASGMYNIMLGSNINIILITLTVITSVVLFIIGAKRRNRTVKPIINSLIAFVLVVPMSLLAFVVATYDIYEKTDYIVSPNNSYVVERVITYGMDNEPNREYIYLQKSSRVNLGILYLCEEYGIYGGGRYMYDDTTPSAISWVDNDTFEIAGISYEVSDCFKQ